MQAGGRAVGAGRKVSNHLASGYDVADLHGRDHRLKVDPPASPHERHQRTARQAAGERDHPRDWRHDRRPYACPQVDPTVPGTVGLGGHREGAHHPGRAHGPTPDKRSGPLGRASHGQEGAREPQNQGRHPEGE
jgi:hypothetical protein